MLLDNVTLGELIAKALAAVKIDCKDVWIENTVRYTDAGNVNYEFVDLVVQTSNFWDEGDDPSSVYDVVSECLRLFGYTLTFTGERYMIYNVISDHDYGNERRDFNWYEIGDIISIGNSKALYYCIPETKRDCVAKVRIAAEEMYKLYKNDKKLKNS